MEELAEIKKRTKPHNVLLVVDAMTGQDAVNVAEQFAETANFDGVILSKLDGDSRGGAALSVKAVTGKPILYASTGEKLGDFERFHPDRMAQRILGMGDVMTLVEKAERQMDERQAAELERKIRKEQFTLDDFLEQMQQVRNMGPLGSLLEDDARAWARSSASLNVDEKELDRLEAIIRSMTPGGAGQPEDHQRLAPAPDRARVGDHRPGGLAARQAVRPDEEGDEADGARARCRRCSSWPAVANLLRPHVRTSPPHPRGEQEEPDLARGRGRPALAARRPLHRDDRALQPADGALDDRDRRGAPPALARPRRPAHQHGEAAREGAREGLRRLHRRSSGGPPRVPRPVARRRARTR